MTTRQWTSNQDGLDKLQLSETSVPQPGKDEVLVEISAVSLNYRDTEGKKAHHESRDS